jgi:hypothetical protein
MAPEPGGDEVSPPITGLLHTQYTEGHERAQLPDAEF